MSSRQVKNQAHCLIPQCPFRAKSAECAAQNAVRNRNVMHFVQFIFAKKQKKARELQFVQHHFRKSPFPAMAAKM
jgi:hypothetical protein